MNLYRYFQFIFRVIWLTSSNKSYTCIPHAENSNSQWHWHFLYSTRHIYHLRITKQCLKQYDYWKSTELLFFFFSFLSFGYIPLGMCCQITVLHIHLRVFRSSSVVKNLPANAGGTGDNGSIPGSERSLGGGNGYSLQYSCLENPMDRGARGARVHRVPSVGHDWGAEHACNVTWSSFILYCYISNLKLSIFRKFLYNDRKFLFFFNHKTKTA